MQEESQKDGLNKIIVTVAGSKYVLKSTEDVKHMEAAASLVDEKLKQIMCNSGDYSTYKASVLVSLQLADELLKAQKECQQLLDEIELCVHG